MSGGSTRTARGIRGTVRQQVSRTVPIDDPGDLLRRLATPDGAIWLRGHDGLIAWGRATRLSIPAGPRRFADAQRRYGEWLAATAVEDRVGLPGCGPVAFGAFTFDPDREGSVLVIPRLVLGRREGQAWLTATTESPGALQAMLRLEPTPAGPPQAHGRVRYAGRTSREIAWVDAVDRAVRRIREGALDKVVLARDRVVWAPEALDPRVLAARLHRRFPQCYVFSIDGLVGATPELLVRRFGDLVTSLVLAGTAARGASPAQDQRLGAALLASPKDRSEHRFSTDSVQALLNPLTDTLGLDAEPWLLRLANVQHLATEVRGRLREPLTALQVAGQLHPTAAVCGTPTDRALALIRELEDLDRSRYAGPVGWLDPRGDGEWGIALRCAELDGRRARLFAGAGIVHDSLPEAELEETRLKLRAMQSALDTE